MTIKEKISTQSKPNYKCFEKYFRINTELFRGISPAAATATQTTTASMTAIDTTTIAVAAATKISTTVLLPHTRPLKPL